MPRRDGTGPEGKGPLTGRGAGSCKRGSRGLGRRPDRPARGAGLGRKRSK